VQVAAPPILKEAGGIHPSILPSLHRLAPLPVPDDSPPSQPGSSGNGALANVALDRALADDPQYSMAVLLRQVINKGVPPSQARLPMTPKQVAASYDAQEDIPGEACADALDTEEPSDREG
jgi:hypothetical protein